MNENNTKKRDLNIADCFTCGRRHIKETGVRRFCSEQCLSAFDNGVRPYAALVMPFDLPKGPNGFLIACLGCQREFDSIGLRCCSSECERKLQKRKTATVNFDGLGGDDELLAA